MKLPDYLASALLASPGRGHDPVGTRPPLSDLFKRSLGMYKDDRGVLDWSRHPRRQQMVPLCKLVTTFNVLLCYALFLMEPLTHPIIKDKQQHQDSILQNSGSHSAEPNVTELNLNRTEVAGQQGSPSDPAVVQQEGQDIQPDSSIQVKEALLPHFTFSLMASVDQATIVPQHNVPQSPQPNAPEAVIQGHQFHGYIDSLNPQASVPLSETVTKSAKGWVHGFAPSRTASMMQQMDDLVESRRTSVFAFDMNQLGSYKGPLGPVKLTMADPTQRYHAAPRRLPAFEQEIEDEKMPPLIASGRVVRRPATAEPPQYAVNNVIVVKKDAEGAYTEKRFCHNYKKPNAGMKSDGFYLPRIAQLMERISSAKYKSAIDARSGFLQLPLAEEDQEVTGFWYRRELYVYKYLPFGIKTASSEYQKRMERAIKDAGLEHCAVAFIDDVLIFSDSWEEHLLHLSKVFDMIEAIGLKCHPDKSIFGAEVIEFLGHTLSVYGLSPSEAKVAAIKALPIPTDLHTLRRVLGFLQYYRDYCPNFSAISSVLTALTRKAAPWLWRADIEGAAYQRLKDLICEPGRALKHADPSKPYILHTDWSQHGMGAVLGQIDDDGKECIVACISRSLNKHERNYASYKGEMLGAVWAVKALDYYLKGSRFTLVTDHAPLLFLMTNDNLQGQYARWALMLQEYEFEIKHRPGIKHQNADALSRHPLPSATDRTGARLDRDAATDSKGYSPLEAATQQAQSAGINDYAWADNTSAFQDKPDYGSAACSALSSLLANNPATTSGDALGLQELSPGIQIPDTLAVHKAVHAMHSAACAAHLSAPEWEGYDGPSDRWVEGEKEEDSGDINAHSVTLVASLHPERTSALRRTVAAWVARSWNSLPAPSRARYLKLQFDTVGHSFTQNIDTHPLPASTMLRWGQSGITLFEPFGGLAAGLEMALRNGIPIKRYLYIDINPAATAIAQHRVQQLAVLYGPHLLPPSAYAQTFHDDASSPWRHLPMDVWSVSQTDLIAAGALDGTQWMVVAGWECQDLSPAGQGAGLQGSRSSSFFPLLHILGSLQGMQAARPPAYLLENTAMQVGKHSGRLASDFSFLRETIGNPILLDAAQLGAGAHRLRNYWTNIADNEAISHVFSSVERNPSLRLENRILSSGRAPQICWQTEQPPMYQANVVGQPIRVLPTLMARMDSYAFRYRASGPGPGLVWNIATQQLVPLTMEEREIALGYAAGSTAAPGVTLQQRHAVTGSCMDAHAMQYIMAVGLALNVASARPSYNTTPRPTGDSGVRFMHSPQPHAGTGVRYSHRPYGRESDPKRTQQLGGGDTAAASAAFSTSSCVQDFEHPADVFQSNVMSAMAADVEDRILATKAHGGFSGALTEEPVPADSIPDREPTPIGDIWLDDQVIRYIKDSKFTDATLIQLTKSERVRIFRRANKFYMVAGVLYRLMSNGLAKEVPPPDKRANIVRTLHEQCGHFGRRRTTHLLLLSYWWKGLYGDVRDCCRNCASCSRVDSSNFGAFTPQLQPLPVMGMFYRWHVDLAGPFPLSTMSNKYVMVCVEAFSKHAELIPIPNKAASTTTFAFLHNVLARYGACAEVVTDQGNEWDAEFYELLTDAFIDHRRTSANRPQSNGLAERCVQTLKRCLRKQLTGLKDGASRWDTLVAWIALGYRVTSQASSGFSPYHMLYAVQPTVPPNVKIRLVDSVDVDGSAAAAQLIAERAVAVQRSCIIAGWNLQIAQHRDTIRYAKLRSGAYLPKIKRYEVGDYVYVKYRTKPDMLQSQLRPEILRVLQVRPGKHGQAMVLRLQGTDGTTVDEHITNCVPCHLPIQEGQVKFGRVDIDYHCQACGFPDDSEKIIRCDGCDKGWHLYCLDPPLTVVPDGDWLCNLCLANSVECLQHGGADDTLSRAGPSAVPQVSWIDPSQQPLEQRPKRRQNNDTGLESVSGVAAGSSERNHKSVRWTTELAVSKDRLNTFKVSEALQRKQLAQRGVSTSLKSVLKSSSGLAGYSSEAVRRSDRRRVVAMTVSVLDLPSRFDFSGSSNGVLTALQLCMPGSWNERQLAGLTDQLVKRQRSIQVSQFRSRGDRHADVEFSVEVQSLISAVDFGFAHMLLDMFSGDGNISTVFQRQLVSNDFHAAVAADYYLDPLQPESYRVIKAERGGIDAIVICPHRAYLDLALPLAVFFADLVVCCYVPWSYFTAAPATRMSWLSQLQLQGRLLLLASSTTRPGAMRSVWIVIFKSVPVRQIMCRPGVCQQVVLDGALRRFQEEGVLND